MKTDQKYRHCPGAVGETVDRVSHSLYGDGLEAPLIQIFLFQEHTGKAVRGVHLRGSQDDAPHAVVGADINLMALRNQHSYMDNIPGFVDRSVKFQDLSEGGGKSCLSDPDSCSLFIDSAQSACGYFLHSLPPQPPWSPHVHEAHVRHRLRGDRLRKFSVLVCHF